MKTKGDDILTAMASIKLTGNIVPSTWYRVVGKVMNKTGKFKADLLAISILAEICYWYRLTEIRDEETQQVIRHEKKFHADKLQLTYEQMAERFGSSKIACKRSTDLLVKIGAIIKDLRHITLKSGARLSNVLFVEPVPEWVKDNNQSFKKSKHLLTKKSDTIYEKINTNTETTTKITTESEEQNLITPILPTFEQDLTNKSLDTKDKELIKKTEPIYEVILEVTKDKDITKANKTEIMRNRISAAIDNYGVEVVSEAVRGRNMQREGQDLGLKWLFEGDGDFSAALTTYRIQRPGDTYKSSWTAEEGREFTKMILEAQQVAS